MALVSLLSFVSLLVGCIMLVNKGFPCGSVGKEFTCNMGDLGSIPGLGRPPGEGRGYPLQYSALENSMYCIVYGVAKSQTLLSDFYLLILVIVHLFSLLPFLWE